MPIFDIIGAGQLASYTIAAMRTGGLTGDILLSPRGAFDAKNIASVHHCEVTNSNQAVADRADIICKAFAQMIGYRY